MTKSKSDQPEKKVPAGNSAAEELKYYGRNACLAIWQRRKTDIIKVYADEKEAKSFGPLLKWCAAQKLAYRLIPAAEMEKVAGALHHEGICILARRPAPYSEKDFETALKSKEITGPLVYLDGVENPLNFGSILRVCAHFGVSHIIGEANSLPTLSGATCRVAEGGAEFVRVLRARSGKDILRLLKQHGFKLLSTTSHGKNSIFEAKLGAKSVLILGGESRGVSKEIEKSADVSLSIPGSGAVESLNVSSACAVVLGECFRQIWKN